MENQTRFSLSKSIEILDRTPLVIETLLTGLSQDWIVNNEGGNTWSPVDIVRHLIHMERINWIPRIKAIHSNENNRPLQPIANDLKFAENMGEPIAQLLGNFKELRKRNVATLTSMQLSHLDFKKTSIHPDLGEVSMMQLLSTWTVHDLSHIGQIARVMAKQYKEEVGPWIAYLKILKH